MNKKKVTLLLLGILAVFIAGCAGLMERHDGTQEQAKIYIQDIYKGAHRDVPKFLIRNDKMATLYLTGKRRVVFKRGDDTMLLDEDVKDKGYARSPSLYAENNHVYAMWWAKTPPRGDKYLYFRASHDGGKTFEPTKIINSGNGVINYYLASDGKGVLAFVYDDERENPYQVYFNISCDYGKTWLDKDIRLDSIQRSAQKRGVFAIEPKVFINGQTLVLTWKERREEEEKAFYYIKSRTSNDGGKSWANEVVIRKANTIFFSDNLIVHNNLLYITGQENETGISGFRSVNNGMTWESIGAIPGTEATVNSGLKVISRGNTLYAVYTSETQHEKNQIWFSAYSPSENKWNKPVRLDRKRNNLTKAINPDFTVLKDGTFVAVWEDYRDIRPNIYMNTSTDNGKTWQDNDSPLGIKGRYSYTLPNLLTKDDTFFVFLHKYRNDARDKTDYLYREFKIDKGYSFRDIEVGRQLSDSEKEKKLKERIASFWTLRTKGQFADTYDYHDPFFREKESKDNFARVQGNITYNRFKVAEIDIKDNIANVKIDYNFEVKVVKIMGMEVSQKPTDDILLEEWVWVYDNWYRVWQNTFGQKYIEY